MSGKLILIGCGPGDLDLLTLRAVNRIKEADLILYDRLVGEDILKLANDQAELIYVGKGCGDGGRQQSGINTMLHDALNRGRTVARLKSGDPMIFGRAAEELAVAACLNAETELVPGVTAALAAASEAVITVTERAELQSFIVTTGKSSEAGKDPDWANLVKPGVCVAFYMSVKQAWRIQTALMAKGVPGHLSADWIENAGKPESRMVKSQLSRLALDAKTNRVNNPAILLVRYPLSEALTSAGSMETEAL